MTQKRTLKIVLITVVTLFLLGYFTQSSARAQGGVDFSETQTENNFPESMVFRVNVSSNVGEIVSAKFVSSTDDYYGSSSYSKEAVEMEAGTNLSLEFVMETGDTTSVPMMPITYYWDVVDAGGNHYQSETKMVRYEDNRFDWQALGNQQVRVLWHDYPNSFGRSVFDIAEKAIQEQYNLFRSGLDYQIIILIYNNRQEFDSWHAIAHEWVGGQSFTGYGITAQIVENASYSSWLNDVIPHEISHLYFQQVTYNPTVSIPVWLNEGIAQYNEFSENDYALMEVESAARRGDLISLSKLENGFGAFNEDRVRLAYNEALSAVTYLVETYGENGLGALLKAYKDGHPTDEAFQQALGVDTVEFEVGWAAWAGFRGEYVVPTAWALPTFRPSPTMPGSGPPAAATAVITAEATEPAAVDPDPVAPPPAGPEPAPPGTSLPCLSCTPAFGLVLGVLLQNRYRKR